MKPRDIHVAVDVGEANTAAVMYHPNGAGIQPLEIHGKLFQPTAIATHSERGILVGTEAIRTPGTKELHMRFKAERAHMGAFCPEHREFIHALLRHWLESGQLSRDAKIRFLISAPFGMTPKELEEYKAAFLSPEISNLELVSESRATILQAHQTLGLTVDDLNRNVFIVNIGGKTIEAGCLSGLKPVLEFAEGVALGCDPIDENILNYLVANDPRRLELTALLSSERRAYIMAVNLAREIKEEYFNYKGIYDQADDGKNLDISCRTEVLSGLEFHPHLTAGEMRTILDKPLPGTGKSWIQSFRDFIVSAKARMLAKLYTPDLILLTGGGSRMDMVTSACQEIFPGVTVHRDTSPETTVANGIARWARISHQTERFRRDASSLCENDIPSLIERGIPELKDRVIGTISMRVIETASIPIRAWRDGSISSLAATEDRIREQISAWLTSREAKQAVSVEAESWFLPLKREILDRAEQLCRKHQIAPEALQAHCGLHLPDAPLSLDSMSFNTLLDPVLAAVGLLISIASASLAGGAGIALLMAGPGGLLIGFLLAASVCFLNRASARTWLYNANVPTILRGVVTEEVIAGRLDAVKQEVVQKLEESITGSVLNDLRHSILEPIRTELSIRLQHAETFIR